MRCNSGRNIEGTVGRCWSSTVRYVTVRHGTHAQHSSAANARRRRGRRWHEYAKERMEVETGEQRRGGPRGEEGKGRKDGEYGDGTGRSRLSTDAGVYTERVGLFCSCSCFCSWYRFVRCDWDLRGRRMAGRLEIKTANSLSPTKQRTADATL
jgi:hypothetical protein